MKRKGNKDKEFDAFAKKWQLDKEEQELALAYERGELRPAAGSAQLKEQLKQAAKRHFEKKARLNIRVTEFDLSRLKRKAALEGLPYQTLAASILHKYVSGTL